MQRELEPRNEFKQELQRWFIDELNISPENRGRPPVEDGEFGCDVDRHGGTPWRSRLLGAVAVVVALIAGLTWLDRPDFEPHVAESVVAQDEVGVPIEARAEPSNFLPSVELADDVFPSTLTDDEILLDDQAAVRRAFDRFIDPDVAVSELDLGGLGTVRSELGSLRRAFVVGEFRVVDVTVDGDRGEVTFEADTASNGDFTGLVFAFERVPRSDEWAITAESLCAVAAKFQRQCSEEDQS